MKAVARGAHVTATMLSPVRQFLAVLLILGAVLLAFLSLQTLIVSGPWIQLGARFLAVVALTAWVSRFILGLVTTREPHLFAALLPSGIAAVVGVWLLAAQFGGPTTRFDPLVTSEHLLRLRDLALAATQATTENMAPIQPYKSIALIAIGGAILVFLLGDLLGNAVRVPAFVGITIIPLWLPHLIIDPDIGVIKPLGTCLCLLALIALDNPFQAPHQGSNTLTSGELSAPQQRTQLRAPQLLRFTTAIAVVTVGVILVVWSVPHLPMWHRFAPPSAIQHDSGIRVSDMLDLSASLTSRSDEIAFSYQWEGLPEGPGPLRTATLTDYRNGSWHPSPPADDAKYVPPEEVLWPFSQGGATTGSLAITVDKFRDTTLPIPVEPRSIDTDLGMTYDPVQDVVQLDPAADSGQRYFVQMFSRDLTAESLKNPVPDPFFELPAGYSEASLSPASDVPDSQHLEDIKKLAAEITANASNDYDKVLALQEYFRAPGNFTYSLTLPKARTEDVTWDFLTDRTGYCVQFSSAMTLMTRSLGIPARLGVGFLPGASSGPNEFTVRGEDAHAWPEVFFDDVGWVRFEPTPAGQSGAAPRWAPDAAGVSPGPTPTASSQPTPTESTTPSQSPTKASAAPSATNNNGGTSASPVGSGVPSSSVWVLLGAGLAVVTALALLAFGLRRRRQSLSGVEEAWRRVLNHATRVGVEHGSNATVRRIADDMEPEVSEDSGLVGPIHELAQLVELERYSPSDHRPITGQEQLDIIVQTACSDLTDRFRDRRSGVFPNVPQGDA